MQKFWGQIKYKKCKLHQINDVKNRNKNNHKI